MHMTVRCPSPLCHPERSEGSLCHHTPIHRHEIGPPACHTASSKCPFLLVSSHHCQAPLPSFEPCLRKRTSGWVRNIPPPEPRTPQPLSHSPCPSSGHERIFPMNSRTSRNFDDFIRRDIEREIAHHERTVAKKQPPPQNPPAPLPTAQFLSQVPDKPLTWLWPGRIPLGHLTLLDAAPGSGLSLLALTLAACVSSGSPLPDGTPTQQGTVILLAPYDSAADTIKPRLEAAGGDPAHVLLFHPLVKDTSRTLARTRPFSLPQDLDHLAIMIRCLEARLVIIDPASAIPGLSRCLPALIELAHQTNCAILLTRSLQKVPADPLHSPPPPSPLLEASRSRLLLTPDPADERHHLLLTTRHPLCPQPSILAYDILASQAGIPLIQWLGERDHTQLARLCTGPLRSPHRQAILRFLQNSPSPQSIPQILQATSYDEEAGRKMLVRMKMAGELVSPARGLYTTATHPCLAHPTDDAPPVPIVPDIASPSVSNVPIVPSPQSPTSGNSSQCDAPPLPDIAGGLTETRVGADLSCPSPIDRPVSPPVCSPAVSVPAVPTTDHITDTTLMDPPVPTVPNPAHSTSEAAQQQIDVSS